MLRKKRKKHPLPMVEVNVVTLMDILTTLLFFLLLVSSLTRFSVVSATALPSNMPSQEEVKPTFTLEVAIKDKRHGSLFLGPIAELKSMDGGMLDSYLRKKKFKGNPTAGYLLEIRSNNHRGLLAEIQSHLVQIKRAFPHEMKSVLSISDAVPYQELVDSIGAVRSLADRAEPFEIKTLLGKFERTRVLFPQVILSELQGGS